MAARMGTLAVISVVWRPGWEFSSSFLISLAQPGISYQSINIPREKTEKNWGGNHFFPSVIRITICVVRDCNNEKAFVVQHDHHYRITEDALSCGIVIHINFKTIMLQCFFEPHLCYR